MPIFTEERPPSRAPQSPDLVKNDAIEPLYDLEGASTERRYRKPSESHNSLHMEAEERLLSRGVLINHIKRGGSPTWAFKYGFGRKSPDQATPKVSPLQSPSTSLLPSVELKESPSGKSEETIDNQSAGMAIERPRSALHSGDFREDKSGQRERDESNTVLATSPVAPWHTQFPSFLGRTSDLRQQSRSSAASQSSYGNFVLKPPTSPLVQATYNSDLDFSARQVPQQRSGSPQKDNRRHTFSPQSLQTYRGSDLDSSPSTPRPMPAMRRESTSLYQAHQPRRSVTSFSQSISNSKSQTSFSRPRGLSNASETSPLHHAPMVGSYEESILRGRMSTTPSRPLSFVAQIGVLGKGKCKSSLKCPPHIILPFPAVFYSYGSGSGRIMDNQPSPYVGHIDIENDIPPPQEVREESRRRKRYASPSRDHDGLSPSIDTLPHSGYESHARALSLKKERLKKRSQSPKAPPGGCYRIPQQGQLQIIIKSPSKTAVKLFLVPYDLSDMEPGQKTFIRQRSYSAGPIIDMPVSVRTNFGTDRPEAALSNSEDPRDRPVLRYLIHLHICCPSRGRFYLYKSIRVVFANRVPDGKEKLRNEIQLPEPRYSPYNPARDSHLVPHVAATTPISTNSLAADRAARRKSTQGFAQGNLDEVDGIDWGSRAVFPQASRPASIKPIPFTLNRLETVESRSSSRDRMDLDEPFQKRPTSQGLSVLPATASSSGRNDPNTMWLERRENSVPNTLTAPCRSSPQGLLARQLRELSVERGERKEMEE